MCITQTPPARTKTQPTVPPENVPRFFTDWEYELTTPFPRDEPFHEKLYQTETDSIPVTTKPIKTTKQPVTESKNQTRITRRKNIASRISAKLHLSGCRSEPNTPVNINRDIPTIIHDMIVLQRIRYINCELNKTQSLKEKITKIAGELKYIFTKTGLTQTQINRIENFLYEKRNLWYSKYPGDSDIITRTINILVSKLPVPLSEKNVAKQNLFIIQTLRAMLKNLEHTAWRKNIQLSRRMLKNIKEKIRAIIQNVGRETMADSPPSSMTDREREETLNAITALFAN